MEYDYEIMHRKSPLYLVPDALSRMFEGNIEDIVNAVTDIGEDSLIAATLETMGIDNTQDEWYRKRYKEVLAVPSRFANWKVMDGQLYFLRPQLVISNVVEDLDRWKLELLKEFCAEALRKSHDTPPVIWGSRRPINV